MHTALLVAHIVAGSLGLALGPIAMLAPKKAGRHTRSGTAYQVCVAVLCLTSFGLAALNPDVWWLALVGAATWISAALGWWAARARPRHWLLVHINGMCSSYISFVTAFMVVQLGFGSWFAWIAPTAVGAPLIGRATAKWARIAAARAQAAAPAEERRPSAAA
ncbi:hypothetical protein [Yinghuangia seranimata]|uniref:hypothetical protein n=1 Tax=Yinghuangia seranimata TaxID=408067 RepID=UPI00248B3195|nr:hypothetical protein [Yinghuangia seranimata]MDI2130735.1 hypothetical protein [Yinghuangia seranimata]